MRHSAQRREFEIAGDRISLGRINRNAGEARSERFGKELELNGGADERATAVSTEVGGMARVAEWRERIIPVEDLDPKIPPEIRRPQQIVSWSASSGGGGIPHYIGVGVG